MRNPAPFLVVILVLLATAAAGPARADRLVPPYDVYEAGPVAPTAFRGLGDGSPWRVIHQESVDGGAWLLLALPDGRPSDALPGAGRPRYLGRVREGERLVLVAPEASGRERLRTGRPLTIAPSQATVLVSGERVHTLSDRAAHTFRLLEFDQPAPRPAVAGAPQGFRSALERAYRARPGARGPGDVKALIAQVSADSLEKYVRTLSEKAGQGTNRYYANPNTEVIHKDYIQRKFRDALGDTNVFNHGFAIDHPDGGTVVVNNVVGRLASGIPGAGAFLLTAHYDAIGTRSDPVDLCEAGLRDPASGCDCSASDLVIGSNPSCAWDWRIDPAPGADDNATGVAALIEAARLLSGVPFDFDLYFVAFQAEEQGLVGSAAFADSLAQAGQTIFGVLNVDMLGYNAVRNEADVITNQTSEWLADLLVDTSAQFVPNLPLEKDVVLFGRSDHASFWSVGIDAVLLFEDIDLPYPGYHRFTDRWDTIFPPSGRPNSELQLQLAVQVAVASIGRFALQYDVPDLALPAGELVVRPFGGAAFEAGRPVLLTANVHNYGASALDFNGNVTDSLTARVTFYDGDPDAGAPLIAEAQTRTFFPAGGIVPVQATWTADPGQEGFHEIHAVVSGLDPGYAQLEPSADNNRSSTSFFLEGQSGTQPELLAHYAYPNPIPGGLSDFRFYFELTRDASRLGIEIYDLGGNSVGRFGASQSTFTGDGNQAGANELTGTDFRWVVPDLESGVYLYSIRVFGPGGGLADVGEGKFAVVR